MIELPESSTISKQLAETISGKKISRVVAGQSPHRFAFFSGDPANYPNLLEGRFITGAQPLSGWVQVRLEDLLLTFHDGTVLCYYKAGERLPAKHQLLLEFEDGSALVCTVQMYGGIHVFQEEENDNEYYVASRDAVSPLTSGFDLHYFKSLWDSAKQTLSAKAFLATEQRIPGLGNGVLQDVLFFAGIHPKSTLCKLDSAEQDNLFGSVKDTLKRMTAEGGRDTERDLFGQEGGYETALSRKSWGKPCPVCGGTVRKEAFLGGSVYYCPACQPLKK